MTYCIYHIPNKKIGVTRDLKYRVEQQQGYREGEYEVLEMSDDELLKIRNFGEKSMRELYEKFAELGLPVEENASEKSEEEADQQEPEEDESK